MVATAGLACPPQKHPSASQDGNQRLSRRTAGR
jgi:hypothetical protein